MPVIAIVLIVVVLFIIVVWIAKPLLAGIGAPAWSYQVVVGIAALIGIYLIAQQLGWATPSLK